MNNELSKSGKITLLKSAAQSIPNFWMSLFFISNGISDATEKLMNDFFWGRGSNWRGINWLAWNKLCSSKA